MFTLIAFNNITVTTERQYRIVFKKSDDILQEKAATITLPDREESIRYIEEKFSPELMHYASRTTEITHYVLKKSNNHLKKEIAVDVFNELSPGVADLYEPVREEIVSYTEVPDEEYNVYYIDEDFDVTKGVLEERESSILKLRTPKKIGYYNRENPRQFNDFFSPMIISEKAAQESILKAAHYLTGDNFKQVHLTSRWSPDQITITYFQKEYSGEMKKEYLLTKAGRRYVDGRYRLIPDYPEIAGTTTIKCPTFKANTLDELETLIIEFTKNIIRYEGDK